jgi:DNA-binding NarL/FixJ family response regulator
MKGISILIVEDHHLLRETWSFILNSDPRISSVAAVGSGEEAVDRVKNFLPDIILMDINLPGIDGVAATQLIKASYPATRVLALSFHASPEYAQKIMEIGASGYVTKSSSRDEVLHAIFEVHSSGTYLCEEIIKMMEADAAKARGQKMDLDIHANVIPINQPAMTQKIV